MLKKKATEQDLAEIYVKRVKERRRYQNGGQRRKRRQAPELASDIVDTLFDQNPEAKMKLLETRAIQAWTRLVGEAAAQVSEALRIRNHQLVVKVQDSLWMQQLSFFKREILAKYRREFAALKLRDIFFVHS